MQELPVESRIIKSVRFEPSSGKLYLRFRNGEERLFTGVPADEVRALLGARSPGQHYIDRIRTRFERLSA